MGEGEETTDDPYMTIVVEITQFLGYWLGTIPVVSSCEADDCDDSWPHSFGTVSSKLLSQNVHSNVLL